MLNDIHLLVKCMFTCHICSDEDRGSSFCNRTWHGLMTALNIQHRPTVSCNPQGDAHAESQVKSCKALIKMAMQRHPRHWCEAARWAA